jgi:hypothetical protein
MGEKFIPTIPYRRPSVPTLDVETFIKDKFKPRTVVTPKWATSDIKLHSTHISAIVFLSFMDLLTFEQNGKTLE